MARRRRWNKISVRFALFVISIFGVVLALYSHYEVKGKHRVEAATSLAQLGVTALPLNDTVSFQDFTVSGSALGISTTTTSLPIVVKGAHGKMEELARRILGNRIFDDYRILVVHERITEESNLFMGQLNTLSSVGEIFYYPNTIDDELIHRIENHESHIKLTELEGEVPRDINGNSMLRRELSSWTSVGTVVRLH